MPPSGPSMLRGRRSQLSNLVTTFGKAEDDASVRVRHEQLYDQLKRRVHPNGTNADLVAQRLAGARRG